MQQRIKNLLKGNFYVISIFVTLFIAYLSLIRVPDINIPVENSDKWGHLFAYFVLSLSWLFSFYDYPKKKYLIVVLCIIYGIIIEILQHVLTSYRTGDYVDAIANTTGVLLGFISYNIIFKKNYIN